MIISHATLPIMIAFCSCRHLNVIIIQRKFYSRLYGRQLIKNHYPETPPHKYMNCFKGHTTVISDLPNCVASIEATVVYF